MAKGPAVKQASSGRKQLFPQHSQISSGKRPQFPSDIWRFQHEDIQTIRGELANGPAAKQASSGRKQLFPQHSQISSGKRPQFPSDSGDYSMRTSKQSVESWPTARQPSTPDGVVTVTISVIK